MAAIPPVVLRPDHGVERPFRYARRPATVVLDVADVYWSVEWSLPAGQHHDQDVVTHPCAHMTVENGHAWVQGVVTQRFSRRLVGSGRVVGVKLRPSGLAALTAAPLRGLAGRRVRADALIGGIDELIADVDATSEVEAGMAAFETWLARQAPRRPDGAALVDEAVELAVGDPELVRVDQLADALAVGVRTLQRRFDRYLGVSPKWVLQRCRIQDALARIEGGDVVDWADVARRLGFADQSHFVTSFTALVGVPPGRYARRPQLA